MGHEPRRQFVVREYVRNGFGERAVSRGKSYAYDKWATQRMFVFVPAQAIVAKFLATFKEFPPRQKPSSFSVGDALASLQTASQGR